MLLVTTLVVSFLVYCRLDVRCWYAGVVSGMQWHLVGFLFFSYHNDARSNKHHNSNVTS